MFKWMDKLSEVAWLFGISILVNGCTSTMRYDRCDRPSGNGASINAAVNSKVHSNPYVWISEHYPNSTVLSQAYVSMNKIDWYDIFEVRLEAGGEIEVWYWLYSRSCEGR